MAIPIDVTIDCREPERLARFWRELLGYVDRPVPAGYASWEEYDTAAGVLETELDAGSAAVDPAGRGPRLFFQRVPEPKVAKNRLHLDVHVSDGQPDQAAARKAVQEHAKRAEGLGATVIRTNPDEEDFYMVLVDPEGNEFCLT
jgi:catechol 2,3-dioxygenase-like lactoylglutathione lyase family enzyme